jgi:hypothetical protein
VRIDAWVGRVDDAVATAREKITPSRARRSRTGVSIRALPW